MSEDMKVIVFQIKDKEYAIPVDKVSGIEKLLHITRVPKALKFVKGVINLRGVITPIIDLRVRFDFEEVEYDESTRIIIVILDDMEVGLIVDSANDVLDIPVESIEPQPEVVGHLASEYISGVAKIEKRLLVLINLEKALSLEMTENMLREG
ncbi:MULTISPECIES: chemotaxis protein CheW [Peribacillus]|jgi:purine-binding chemotaxis protein CheW|uniref:Chemotaxis protein CheW n=1 Tax=Peribacillus frigoritolerans TaxID=450367 RepID=A0AAJ1VDP5_9BACI|nr:MULTISPECIES: chemotaxis protein CheW [Peribacillus]MCD1160410.1 chemotaxis protein CheW [Peribacillus castrilensis]MBX9954798.1 chemotaxis protein CheW [Peribacillus simplex]MCM3165733.1 chemotaxis protein CheW [Peribacillus frigoritolerans]MDM5283573.1 chemotaxis protein CheW [Peribacillus frigoritolerans]MEB2630473.1 chemotaxis protein CheW [Peribacillus frigoritolerans]